MFYRYNSDIRIPSKLPKARLEEMNQLLADKDVLRVYCDSSFVKGSGIAGLAACYVGCDCTFVESRKVYFAPNFINNIYFEYKAVEFAVNTTSQILLELRKLKQRPRHVIYYSDLESIESVFEKSISKDAETQKVLDCIRKGKIAHNYLFDTVEVKYLGIERKNNIYLKAAHNASRKVIGKSK